MSHRGLRPSTRPRRPGLVLLLWLSLLATARAAGTAGPDDDAEIQRQRDLIGASKAEAEVRLERELADCATRFVQTRCELDARAAYRQTLSRLRGLENALADEARQRRAAERRRTIVARRQQAAAGALADSVADIPAEGSAMPPPAGASPEAAGAAEEGVAPSLPVSGSGGSGQPRPAASPVPGLAAAAARLGRDPHADLAVTLRQARAAAALQAWERRQAQAKAHADAVARRNAEQDARRKPAEGLPLPELAASAPHGSTSSSKP